MMDWIRDHAGVILIAIVVIFVLALVVGLLLTWLSSRGRFMFLDGVVRNRGAVSEPWHEYRWEANSLFKFRVCLGIVSLLAMLVGLGCAGLMAWPDIHRGVFGGAAMAAIGMAVLTLLGVVVITGAISVLLRDFVVPIMYLRRIGVMSAWREFNSTLLPGHLGTFTLYFLMRILIAMVLGVLTVIFVLLTCCIAAIPYVGTVITLPLTVFSQAYPLYFLEQFGPEWQVFKPEKPPMPTSASSPFGDGAY